MPHQHPLRGSELQGPCIALVLDGLRETRVQFIRGVEAGAVPCDRCVAADAVACRQAASYPSRGGPGVRQPQASRMAAGSVCCQCDLPSESQHVPTGGGSPGDEGRLTNQHDEERLPSPPLPSGGDKRQHVSHECSVDLGIRVR